MKAQYNQVKNSICSFWKPKLVAFEVFLIMLPFNAVMAMSSGADKIKTLTGGTDRAEGLAINWPWRRFLDALMNELTGPLPITLGVLGIAVAAIGMFMGNHGAGMQKFLVLIFAVSICLFAPSFINFIQQGAGGATILGM